MKSKYQQVTINTACSELGLSLGCILKCILTYGITGKWISGQEKGHKVTGRYMDRTQVR